MSSASSSAPSPADKWKKVRKPRNWFIARGIPRFGQSALNKRKGAWAIKKKALTPKKPVEKKANVKPFQGKTRTIVRPRLPRVFPFPASKKTHKSVKPTRLRASIQRGTVLILLAGRFRGRRVVFLKQLPSGLLLVTGPFKVNGVPLRRVNQAYVIATSTKVHLPKLKVDKKFNDDYFKSKAAKRVGKKTEQHFFAGQHSSKSKTPPEQRVADQKAIDAHVVEAVKKQPLLKDYLSTSFSLRKGQYPHLLKF